MALYPHLFRNRIFSDFLPLPSGSSSASALPTPARWAVKVGKTSHWPHAWSRALVIPLLLLLLLIYSAAGFLLTSLSSIHSLYIPGTTHRHFQVRLTDPVETSVSSRYVYYEPRLAARNSAVRRGVSMIVDHL